MPVTAAQLDAGANYQLQTYASGDPIDNFNEERPLTKWLIKNMVASTFMNGVYNAKVYVKNDSNYQHYTGDEQVSFNKKDTIRRAPFYHYEDHDGFSLNETELADNGIVMTDDRNAVITQAEKLQIVNKLAEGWLALKEGFQENFDLTIHRDGSQAANAAPGLDLFVSTTPTTGVIGLDPATYSIWQNQALLNISTATAGNLVTNMEAGYRDAITRGKRIPDAWFVGSKFYDAYKTDSLNTITRQLMTSGNSPTNIDASTGTLSFKGKPLIWDPTMDALEVLDSPVIPWDKRCYGLNSKALVLRPNKGRWMINRKPSRVYDRYTHYFAVTSDYGLTMNQRNCLVVMSIA
jgi:hypothetical protein